MRTRIRSIKPEVHLDEELWDLEQETGLPIFRSFTGLWNCSDREGRFEWRPRPLKAAILPYWEGDFSRVLHALSTRGFIQKYEVSGREYGLVRTFTRHQVINNREEPSKLPTPPDSETIADTTTRDARVNDASGTPLVLAQAEGKGREGKGTRTEGNDACTRDFSFNSNRLTELFSEMRRAAGGGGWQQNRTHYDKLQGAVAWARAERPDDPLGACSESIAAYLRIAPSMGDWANGWPFAGWANDPGKWLLIKPRDVAKARGLAPVADRAEIERDAETDDTKRLLEGTA